MTIKKIAENTYEIKKEGKMLVPGIIFASKKLFESIEKDGKTIEQVKNVAQLPGIVEKSIALPDAHQGYGFSIGGVAAFDLEKGIISPGGVGYDIGCGVRLIATNLTKKEFLTKRDLILTELNKNIPSGVGKGGEYLFSEQEMNEILKEGAEYLVNKKSLGTQDDLKKTEENGKIKNADPSKVSQKAKARGKNQLGTMGAGNHFVEIQEVDQIYDKKRAEKFGILEDGQIAIMVHTGSRGLGHQTASDYIMKMEKQYGFKNLPDRELINAPIKSSLGEDYQSAMAAAANFAFANRQLITHQIRKSFKKYFPKATLNLVYDVAHNIAKFEEFNIGGKKQTLCIHRKGATRSREGIPILIPGSMGTFSYVLVGTKEAESLSFASTAHGAGRIMSRTQAKREITSEHLKKELEDRDVSIKAGSIKGMIEEAPEAYKDVNEVVRVSDELGIGKLVARLKPLAVIKG